MAASYPTAVKAFTTRTAGQTISSAHVNDLQDEVNAMQQALLTSGLAHHLLFVDATYDIGQSGATRPRHLFMSGNATVGSDLLVGAAPATTGAVRLSNAASVYARNAANTLNFPIIGTDSSNNIVVGDSGRVTTINGGNLGVGTTTFGTNAVSVIGLANGTAPTTSPADMVQLFSVDASAGNATLGLRTEAAVATESVTSDRTLQVVINGTVYKVCLKA